MVNELYEISNVLSVMNINAKSWHKDYLPLPMVKANAPCIRIWLKDDGSVSDFGFIDSNLAQKLRKYGNNQGTFPAFNISPLYRITNDNQIEVLHSIQKDSSLLDLDKLRGFCIDNKDNWQNNTFNWSPRRIRHIDCSLNNRANELLSFIKSQNRLEETAVARLVGITTSYKTDGCNSFRSALEECVFRKLENKEDIKLALTLLFKEGDSKKDVSKRAKEDDCGSLSVFLDLIDDFTLNDDTKFFPIAHENTTEWINDVLVYSSLGNTKLKNDSLNHTEDAYGSPYVESNEPMPKVKLPGLSYVIIRAMFHEQLSQKRYGFFDDNSYPISPNNRNRTKKALEWIADSGKRGITWDYTDDKEIVLAFPSKFEKVPISCASLLGANISDDSHFNAKRFENRTQEFIKSFRGYSSTNKPDNIHIFFLRKMDRSRCKVVYTRTCSPDYYIKSALNWQDGCRNTPAIALYRQTIIEQATPFPVDIARVINTIWRITREKGGKKIGKLKSIQKVKTYQGVGLLLDNPNENTIKYYLSILLINTRHLFVFAGGAKIETEPTSVDYYKNSLSEVCATIGLLLFKSGYLREVYMEKAAFLVGQLLKVSDDIHALYCKVVRDNDIPPQLVGNALFITASETPIKAMAQLSLRMNPYLAWARRFSIIGKTADTKGNEEQQKEIKRAAGLVGWFLAIYENTATLLSDQLTHDMRFDEYERSQVFLGYLAAYPPKKHDKDEDKLHQTEQEGDLKNE